MGSQGPNAVLARMCGLRLISDLPELLCDVGLSPILDDKRRERLRAVKRARTLFIHVPKNAGMSISSEFYGLQIKHATVRYYLKVAPTLLSEVDSLAVVRDPVERFESAFSYACRGGTGDNRVSNPFRARYMQFKSIDDALNHVESAKSFYHVDHIFRPQNWYISDNTGLVRVKRLLPFSRLKDVSVRGRKLPAVNRREGPSYRATQRQAERIRQLYAADMELLPKCGLA